MEQECLRAQQQVSAGQHWGGLLCQGNGIQDSMLLYVLFCSFEEMHERGEMSRKCSSDRFHRLEMCLGAKGCSGNALSQ